MTESAPLQSPLFWFGLAVLVGLLLTYFRFRTELQLRRQLRRLSRKAGEPRVPVEALLSAPGSVRSEAARALGLLNAGRPGEAAQLLDRVSNRLDGAVRAELTNLAGVGYHMANRFDLAAERYQQAALSAETEVAAAVRAAGFANLGLIRLLQNEPALAHSALEQALALDRETGNRAAVAVGLGRLGLTWQARGEAARALDLHQEALELNRAAGNTRGVACDLGRIGLAWQVIGEHDKALDCYRQGRAAARKARDYLAEAEMMGNTGLLQLERGEEDEALAGLLGALARFGGMGDTIRSINTVNGLGLVRKRLGPEAFAAGCRRFGVGPREMERLNALLDRLGKENAPGPEPGTPAHTDRED